MRGAEGMISNTIYVLYQFDAKYAPYAGVSITSLLLNNADYRIHLFLIIKDVCKEDLVRIEQTAKKHGNAEITFIDAYETDLKLNKLGIPSYRGSQATNYKLFIDELIPDYVERIVYIDSDTIVENSLETLIDYNMDGHPVAMVMDSVSNNIKTIRGFKPTDPYYNAGVILYDLNEWRRQDCKESLLDEISKGKRYAAPDQDLLNISLKNNICTLPPRYNIQPIHFAFSHETYYAHYKPLTYYEPSEIEEAVACPTIIHCFRFLGTFPWHANNLHPNNDRFDHYLKQSYWAEYSKEPAHNSPIFSFENMLYKMLPRRIFLPIFDYSFTQYQKKKQREVAKGANA